MSLLVHDIRGNEPIDFQMLKISAERDLAAARGNPADEINFVVRGVYHAGFSRACKQAARLRP